MEPAEYWALIAALVAAAVWGFWRGFRWWHWARLIEDTPTSRVRSAAQGYTELIGTSRRMPGEPVFAPLTRLPCTWWSYVVEKRVHSGRRRRWKVIARQASEHLFHLRDETGLCIIDPEGAEVLPAATDRWHGDTPMPVAGPSGIRGFRGLGSDYRYRESRLHDGDPLYAIGWFRTEAALQPGALEDEVAALLRSWKRDQASLLQRFDADSDGTLSLAEWERAREAAHEQVRQDRRAQSIEPGAHVLSRPPHDDRPLLLGAGDEAGLARRYRWRSAGGLTLFLGATIAVTWLLLNPLA